MHTARSTIVACRLSPVGSLAFNIPPSVHRALSRHTHGHGHVWTRTRASSHACASNAGLGSRSESDLLRPLRPDGGECSARRFPCRRHRGLRSMFERGSCSAYIVHPLESRRGLQGANTRARARCQLSSRPTMGNEQTVADACSACSRLTVVDVGSRRARSSLAIRTLHGTWSTGATRDTLRSPVLGILRSTSEAQILKLEARGSNPKA